MFGKKVSREGTNVLSSTEFAEADLTTESEREASTAGFSSRVQQNILHWNKSVSVEIAAISAFACQDEVDLHRVQLCTQIHSVY